MLTAQFLEQADQAAGDQSSRLWLFGAAGEMGLAVQSSKLLQHKRYGRPTTQVGHPGREAAEDTVDVELAWQPATGPDLHSGEESS